MVKKRLILMVFLIALTSSPVNAGTVTWDHAGSGQWSSALNWSLDIVPGLADDVFINTGAGAITVDTEARGKTLILRGHSIVLSSGRLTLGTAAPDTLYVSKSGNNGNSGSIDFPKLTIAGAIAAITSDITKIYVSAGTYDESVTLNNGISLFGGFSSADWSNRNIMDRSNATYKTVIQGSPSSSCGIAFTGASVAEWVLEGFDIGSSATTGFGSDGVCVTSTGTATIRYNTINGGAGQYESNGIYVHGESSKTIIDHNDINGGASDPSSSSGILIETSADSIISSNTINGGTGANASHGIQVTHALANTSRISYNIIDGGSSAGGQSYGLQLANNNPPAASLAVAVYGNYIRAANIYWAYGIYGYGNSASLPVNAGIFNNVIEANATNASGRAYGIYLLSAAGTPLVYNNTIAVSSVANNAYGMWSEALSPDRATTADVRNNIFLCESTLPHDYALYELANGLSSIIKNNDIYNCTTVISTVGGTYVTVAGLNGLRAPATSGNIDDNPSLDGNYNLTISSPFAVTLGGLDLSGVTLFPENSSHVKIDKAGNPRSAPWSIGAYERD
jgi:hypothetical protein